MVSGKELTIRGLHARGFTVDTAAKTSKYLVFAKSGFNRKYLIGNAGALRVVDVGAPIGGSISLTGTRSHKAFQEVGKHAECFTTVEQAEQTYHDAMAGKMLTTA